MASNLRAAPRNEALKPILCDLGGLDHHLLHGQGGAGLATMPPSSALLATTTAGSTFGQPRLRGTYPFPFATKQTLLQFGELGFEDLDLVLQLLLLSQSSRMQALVRMSLLAQLDFFQPKFFLSISHWKVRLPGDEEGVPNKMGSPENSLWSRCLRRNPVLVIHRILTCGTQEVFLHELVTTSLNS